MTRTFQAPGRSNRRTSPPIRWPVPPSASAVFSVSGMTSIHGCCCCRDRSALDISALSVSANGTIEINGTSIAMAADDDRDRCADQDPCAELSTTGVTATLNASNPAGTDQPKCKHQRWRSAVARRYLLANSALCPARHHQRDKPADAKCGFSPGRPVMVISGRVPIRLLTITFGNGAGRGVNDGGTCNRSWHP